MVGLFDGCLFSIHRAPKDEAEKILPLLTTTTALSEDEGISYQRVVLWAEMTNSAGSHI